MPHTSSAKKHQRQSEKRRIHNRAIKRSVKTYIKRVIAAAQEENPEKLREEFKLAVKKLDKAAAKHIIHPNMAARKKSQLARFVNGKLNPSTGQAPAPQ